MSNGRNNVSDMSLASGVQEDVGDEVRTEDTSYRNGAVGNTRAASTKTIGSGRTAPNMDFGTRLIAAQSARSLSPDGEVYFKDLIALIEKEGFKYERLPRTNGYFIHNDLHGVVLIFAEHVPVSSEGQRYTEYTPVSRQCDRAITETQEIYPNIPVLDSYLVIPEDYTRASNMFNQIKRTFEYGLTDVMRYEDFSDKNVFRLSNNLYQIKTYTDQLSPNGIMPHIQFGVAVEYCADNNYDSRRDDSNYRWIPYVVIGAYVDFAVKERVRDYDQYIQPIVHISSIVTPVPSLYVLPVALSAAYEMFIGRETWKDVFTDFTGKQPNIGSLLINEKTNRPTIVESIRQRDQFIAKCCCAPIFTIDIQEGRASIPGLKLLINKKHREVVKNILADFFSDSSIVDKLDCVVFDSVEEYTGVVNDNGSLRDTRSIDYFRVIENIQDLEIAANFLVHTRPEDRMKDIKDAGFNELKSYYSNWTCIFDPGDIITIADKISTAFTPIMGDMKDRSMMGFNFSPDLGERFRRPFANGGSILRPGGRTYTGRYTSDLTNVYRTGYRRY